MRRWDKMNPNFPSAKKTQGTLAITKLTLNWFSHFPLCSYSLSLPACFYKETCGKATRQKCSTMEKSGNICQSSQRADGRWPNMMSGSEAATADRVPSLSLSLRSSSLFITRSNRQTPHALTVSSRFWARINTRGHKPKTLEILSFLRWCCSGELSK